MKPIKNLPKRKWTREALVIALALLVSTGVTAYAAGTGKPKTPSLDESKIVTGSGSPYRTMVERRTEGELSEQDIHQASLLTSHVVKHLNEAVENIFDENTQGVRNEIEAAQKLIKLVRNLLPVTTVTTIVEDAGGKEIYRETDRVQNDRIPLYSGMIAMEILEPVIKAKKDEADLKGLVMDRTEVINTSMLADLSYIERKINRAAAALSDDSDEALAQLVLAQTHGIMAVANPSEAPLVQVQASLHLAEQMVAEGNHDAARENLTLAKIQLETYRELLGQNNQDGHVIQQLENDISGLINKTREKGATAKIREYWEKTVNLFHKEPGQTQPLDKEVKG